MNSIKRLNLTSTVTSLLLVVGCTATHESIGHDETGNAGGTSSSDGTPQGTSIGTTVQLESGNAFGDVGFDPTQTKYERALGLSPKDTTRACDTTSITGTIDGDAIDQLYNVNGQSATGSVQGSALEIWLDEPGRATLSTATNTPESNLSDLKVGTKLIGLTGHLSLPYGLSRANSYLCVTGTTSLERATNQLIISYTGIGYLPDCDSGSPVSGEIDICEGSSCGTFLSGNIDSKIYDLSGLSYDSEGQSLAISTSALELRTTYVAVSATTARLKNTWLTDTATGNVYCAGAKSHANVHYVDTATGISYDNRLFYLQDLRLVGNCSQVSGTETLVVRTCTMD
jgi:hypothetical protein